MNRGLFMAFYGINNLGKTLQSKDKLTENLKKNAILAEYIKYARYDLEPTGPILNDYLRNGNPYELTPREFQLIQAQNRIDYQPELQRKLNSGIHVIAEDYIGTSLAWGMGADVSGELLEQLNSKLIQPDICFLFHGERFSSGIEAGHKHENDNELTQKVARIHDELGKKYGWTRVFANRSIEEIETEIFGIVIKKLREKNYYHQDVVVDVME